MCRHGVLLDVAEVFIKIDREESYALIYSVEDDENSREIATIALKNSIIWSVPFEKRQPLFLKKAGGIMPDWCFWNVSCFRTRAVDM